MFSARLRVMLMCSLCVALGCGDDGAVQGSGVNNVDVQTVYVDVSASKGGDGTVSNPYKTLKEALERGDDITRVIIASGTYELPASHQVSTELTLEGAGSALNGTSLTIPAGQDVVSWSIRGKLTLEKLLMFVPFSVTGGETSLSELVFNGAASLAVSGAADAEATVSMDGVEFRESGGVSLTDLQRATFDDVAMGQVGQGISATDVDQLSLSNVAIDGVTGTGILMENVIASFSGVTVSNTSAGVDGVDNTNSGDGVSLRGGELSWGGGLISNTADRGLRIIGGTGTLEDLEVNGSLESAVSVQGGAQVIATRVTTVGGLSGFFASGVETSLTVTDSDVTSAKFSGLLAGDNSTLDISGTTFEACEQGSISLVNNAHGVLDGNTLSGTSEICLSVAGATSRLEITGNVISGCVGAGIGLLDVDDALVEGNTISNVMAASSIGGQGLNCIDAVVDVFDNDILDVEGPGMNMLRALARIEGNRISNTEGAGVSVLDPRFDGVQGERVSIKNNVISDVKAVGISVFTANADIEDNTVERVRFDNEVGLGEGVLLALQANVVVRGNTIRSNAANGILFDGAFGVIEGNNISGHVQYGIRQYCTDDSEMTIGENLFEDNSQGDLRLCD